MLVEGFPDLTLQVTLLQSTTGGVDWRDAFDALAPTGVVLQVGTMIGDPPKRERMERMVEMFGGRIVGFVGLYSGILVKRTS